MARFEDRKKALALRMKGMSYSQIKNALKISKSTLSCWLRDYPLSKQRIDELRGKNEQRIERFRETMKRKHRNRLEEIYREQKENILPLRDREIFIFGLGLYWGEGTKSYNSSLSISNTDPSIIKFFILWMRRSLNVSKEKLKVHLHLYKDMDIEKETKFWEDVLGISRKQFIKPYIKESSSKSINHKGGFGHGTCNIRIGDVKLSEKILMAIKTISDEYSTRV
jgi:predicted transcriptional regulator